MDQAEKLFEGQIATLEIIIIDINRAISALKRSVEGKTNFGRDARIIRHALTHFIVNNLAALFANNRKDINSLPRIIKNFENEFSVGFFSEYSISLKKFQIEHNNDLKRIEKNRNLMTGHLSVGKKEQLGYDPRIAKNLDEILGIKSPIAGNNSLLFITSFQLLEMDIIKDISNLKDILEGLNKKFLFRNYMDI